MNRNDLSPTNFEVQGMTESALQICEGTALERCIGAMVQTMLVSVLEASTREAAEGQKVPVSQAVGNIVRQAFAQDTIHEVIYINVGSLAEPQEFIEHLTLNLIKIRH